MSSFIPCALLLSLQASVSSFRQSVNSATRPLVDACQSAACQALGHTQHTKNPTFLQSLLQSMQPLYPTHASQPTLRCTWQTGPLPCRPTLLPCHGVSTPTGHQHRTYVLFTPMCSALPWRVTAKHSLRGAARLAMPQVRASSCRLGVMLGGSQGSQHSTSFTSRWGFC